MTVVAMVASQFGPIGLNVTYAAAPTVTVAVTDNALKISETSLVTFTFSEAVSGFDNTDLTISSGLLSPVTSADNIVWTGTLTPTNGIEAPSNVITVSLTGVADIGLTPGVGTTDSNNYAIDTVAPTATMEYSTGGGFFYPTTIVKSGFSNLTIRATFSEPIADAPTMQLFIDNGVLGWTGMVKMSSTTYFYNVDVPAGN